MANRDDFLQTSKGDAFIYFLFFSRVPLIKALDLEWNCEKVLNIIRLVLGQKTFNGPVNGARLVCKTVFVLFTFNKDLLMHYSAREIVKFAPFSMEYKSLALK